MRKLTAVLGTVAVIGAGGVVAGAPASAGDSALPLTESQLRSASMQLSDIPNSFSKNPKRTTDYAQGGDTFRFETCIDENGDKIFGKKPAQEMNATVTLKESPDTSDNLKQRATSSDIYGYKSASAARKAWKKLGKATDGCAAKVSEDLDFGDLTGSAKVKQKVADVATSNGAPGFSIAQKVGIDIGGSLTIYVGGYTVYRQVGTTITRIQFINLTSKSAEKAKLKAKWKSFTRSESVTVTGRVAALPTR